MKMGNICGLNAERQTNVITIYAVAVMLFIVALLLVQSLFICSLKCGWRLNRKRFTNVQSNFLNLCKQMLHNNIQLTYSLNILVSASSQKLNLFWFSFFPITIFIFFELCFLLLILNQYNMKVKTMLSYR